MRIDVEKSTAHQKPGRPTDQPNSQLMEPVLYHEETYHTNEGEELPNEPKSTYHSAYSVRLRRIQTPRRCR